MCVTLTILTEPQNKLCKVIYLIILCFMTLLSILGNCVWKGIRLIYISIYVSSYIVLVLWLWNFYTYLRHIFNPFCLNKGFHSRKSDIFLMLKFSSSDCFTSDRVLSISSNVNRVFMLLLISLSDVIAADRDWKAWNNNGCHVEKTVKTKHLPWISSY